MKLRLLIDSKDECTVVDGVARIDAREAAALAETFRTSRRFRDFFHSFIHMFLMSEGIEL